MIAPRATHLHPGSTALAELEVMNAEHHGLHRVSEKDPLSSVAQIMGLHHVHAVIVENEVGDVVGVISDIDLITAALEGDPGRLTASEIAGTEPLRVRENESLERAAQLFVEHQVTHLVVCDPESGVPVGVLSTLDVARAIAARG